MTTGSFCSGIGAPERAGHLLGWQSAYVSEIEPFPCAVLAHHFPDAPNLGDMTRITAEQLYERPVDLLVAGTPCQSFSVAGLRQGMADPRGNLALEFLRLVDAARPRWVVWENVPGVLSSSEGRDFGCFLGGLGQLGYGWAYRVLDAQFVRVESHARAVPQRRRRVFVVGCLGSWQRAAAVLFERQSMCGHPPPRREAGTRTAGGLAPGIDAGRSVNALDAHMGSGGPDDNAAQAMRLVPVGFSYIDDGRDAAMGCVPTLRVGTSLTGGIGGNAVVAHSLTRRHDSSEDGCGRGTLHCAKGPSEQQAVAFTQNQAGDLLSGPVSAAMGTNCNATGRNTPKVMQHMTVRRLTPLECERLQGFPDNWTAVPYRGKPAADGPRYRALGNSMAVNCMVWLFQRIAIVHGLS